MSVEKDEEVAETAALVVTALLSLKILVDVILKKFHHRHLPLSESSATILLGMILGAVIYLIVHVGGVTGLPRFRPSQFEEVFTLALLPPIIFAAGFTMKKRNFFKNFGSILTLAIPGTIISTIIIGACLYFFVNIGWLPNSDNGGLSSTIFTESLLVGALLSATDPVATLAVFQELNVTPLLYSLVFGESVLNDAISIVLFRVLVKYVSEPLTGAAFGEMVGSFLLMMIGSTLVGLVVAAFTAIILHRLRNYLETSMQIIVMLFGAYFSFLSAEALYMSGIMSLFLCGIMMSHYHWYSLNTESQITMLHMTSTIAFIAEAIVFLSIGLVFFDNKFTYIAWNPAFIILTLLLAIISRFFNIFPLCTLLNRGRKPGYKIENKYKFLLWFSGLRGAIALILSFSLPQSMVARTLVINTTLVIVLVTNVLFGPATKPLLHRLNIEVGGQGSK